MDIGPCSKVQTTKLRTKEERKNGYLIGYLKTGYLIDLHVFPVRCESNEYLQSWELNDLAAATSTTSDITMLTKCVTGGENFMLTEGRPIVRSTAALSERYLTLARLEYFDVTCDDGELMVGWEMQAVDGFPSFSAYCAPLKQARMARTYERHSDCFFAGSSPWNMAFASVGCDEGDGMVGWTVRETCEADSPGDLLRATVVCVDLNRKDRLVPPPSVSSGVFQLDTVKDAVAMVGDMAAFSLQCNGERSFRKALMTQFAMHQLSSHDPSSFFRFGCNAAVAVSNACDDRYGDTFTDGKLEILAQTSFGCLEGEAISGFRLEKQFGGQVRSVTTCCTVAMKNKATGYNLAPFRVAGQDASRLSHSGNARCNPGWVLLSWALNCDIFAETRDERMCNIKYDCAALATDSAALAHEGARMLPFSGAAEYSRITLRAMSAAGDTLIGEARLDLVYSGKATDPVQFAQLGNVTLLENCNPTMLTGTYTGTVLTPSSTSLDSVRGEVPWAQEVSVSAVVVEFDTSFHSKDTGVDESTTPRLLGTTLTATAATVVGAHRSDIRYIQSGVEMFPRSSMRVDVLIPGLRVDSETLVVETESFDSGKARIGVGSVQLNIGACLENGKSSTAGAKKIVWPSATVAWSSDKSGGGVLTVMSGIESSWVGLGRLCTPLHSPRRTPSYVELNSCLTWY